MKNYAIILGAGSGNRFGSYKQVEKIKSELSKKDSEKYLLKNRYIKGENLIYVCVNNTCKYPVSTVDQALKLITNNNE